MMKNKQILEKLIVVSVIVIYFIFGRTLTYFSSTDVFIDFAKKIGFSIKHLANYISILFYIIHLMLYLLLFSNDISQKDIYISKLTNRKPKKIISIIIVSFTIFAFLVSSISIPIGTKFNNSIIGAVVSFLLMVLFAPIAEELFFRVILINHLRRNYEYTIKKIILIQAFLFYIPHLLNGNYTLYTFYIGIISGIFYYYTESIIYSIILHSLANCATFLLTLNVINYRLPITTPIWFVLFIFLFAFFYYMLRNLVKILEKHELEPENSNFEKKDV